MKKEFQIRAGQIYLQIQLEKVEYVCSFIDFLAAHGYNTLFIYLGWRIKCDTYDLGEGVGYTKKELRTIVEYAAKKGLEVIPGLNMFGHADPVLKLPQYKDMAELRDGNEGREHNNDRHVFCLSSQKAKKFIASFLEEMMEVFPGRYIHAGFDEALDVGYCKECRERIRTFADEEDLVLEHIHFVRDIIVNKGKKRMMMWDDLLPSYPSIIEKMEKDVILCPWQYHQNVCEYYSYCYNCTFENTLRRYRNLGYDCVVCPADCAVTNPETYFSWGEHENVLGGLVTAWPKRTFTPEQSKLTTGAAGLLMSRKAENIEQGFRMCLKGIFGDMPEEFISAAWYLRSIGYRADEIQSLSSLSRFPMFGIREESLSAMTLAWEEMKKYEGRFASYSQAWYIWQEMYCEAKSKQLSFRSQKAAYRMLHHIDGESLSDIAKELDEAYDGKRHVAESLRRKSDTSFFESNKEQWKKTLLEMEEKLSVPHTLCRVVFCLPLTYGNTVTSILAVKDGKETLITKGNFKITSGYEVYSSHFEWFFILPADFEAEELKITAEGFTGTGISFVEFMTPDGGELVAESIKEVSGIVANAHHLLAKTDTFAYFGKQDGFACVRDRNISEMVNSVVLKLKKVK